MDGLKNLQFCQEAGPEHDHSLWLDRATQQLSEYFEGKRTVFHIPLVAEGTHFQHTVWDEIARIPFGNVISYEELARRLGDVKTIRAAASANGKNPLPIIVPCHRVIGKDGSLTGYSGGLNRKKWLLEFERGDRTPRLF